MWGWGKRKQASYAKPGPKVMTLTTEEVMDLVALVGATYNDSSKPGAEDPELQALIDRCVEAKRLVHRGHLVTITVSHGELETLP